MYPRYSLLTVLLAATALLSTACSQPSQPPPTVPKPAAESPAPKEKLQPPAGTSRIIAIGDIHGDLSAAKAALRAGKLIDANDKWVGGKSILVQTGDVLDRGDDEPEILALLRRLRDEAALVGGQVVLLNGNHEVMNVAGDLRYVTPGGFEDYAKYKPATDDPRLARLPEHAKGRAAAFMPGSAVATMLSDYPVIAVVEQNVFVHGGVLPRHVHYGVDRLNGETSAWMRGETEMPAELNGEESPIWTRLYSHNTDTAACAKLRETLSKMKAKRMIVGHTVQPQVTSACDGAVWRVDVGMARHYGGPIQVIEILGDQVNVLNGSR